MTPLIEVTNTVGLDSPPDCLYTGSLRKSGVKTPRGGPRIPDANGLGEVDNARPVKNSKISGEAAAIKMCNTQVSNPVGSGSSCQGITAISHRHPCATSPMRVPPLPQTTDILLSQAVQALSLGPLTTQTRPRTRRRQSKHQKGNVEQSDGNNKKLASSCSGLPENSGGSVIESAPQQCGACGLEFTSLPVLTQHLARHVYDGLYAAQWLTQAMGLAFSRPNIEESDPVVQGGNQGSDDPPSSSSPRRPAPSKH